ncbi:hypothetical protein [Pseudomonas sp. NPDC089406]|uniref:hypothetical protein n=1 Tax=Pseudomonas sp. NPDC089406 TaxID=3364463 RepID=UPI00384BCE41
MPFKLPLALLATLTASSAFANPEYAIENPLRPGAKAAHCSSTQTVDGCIFHSVAGDTYTARLPFAAGEHWVASSAEAGEVAFEQLPASETEGGQAYQLIKLLPNPAHNADASVTFDKLTGQGDAQKVIERRRISVMIHPA